MNEDRDDRGDPAMDGAHIPVTPAMMEHFVRSMYTTTSIYLGEDGSTIVTLDVEVHRVDGLYVQLEFTMPMIAGLVKACGKVLIAQFPAPVDEFDADELESLFDRTEDRGDRGDKGDDQ